MTLQPASLFDATESERRKRDGMAAAEMSTADMLALARSVAVDLGRARHSRLVHADDVGEILKGLHGIDTLGPAAGSLFKTDDWEWSGLWHKSSRVTNHSRMLRVWRLK